MQYDTHILFTPLQSCLLRRIPSHFVPVYIKMTVGLYSWMSADQDPSSEPYNLVERALVYSKTNMVKPVWDQC